LSSGDFRKKEFTYTYDLDRLIQIEEKVDGIIVSTQALDYDGAGNVITDGEYTYTWQMGRQLQGISGADLITSYKYNENGLRTEKIVNGMKHEYTYLDSSVTREVIKELYLMHRVILLMKPYCGPSTIPMPETAVPSA
jgi:hypothetical protein